jgi:hypothetical protein
MPAELWTAGATKAALHSAPAGTCSFAVLPQCAQLAPSLHGGQPRCEQSAWRVIAPAAPGPFPNGAAGFASPLPLPPVLSAQWPHCMIAASTLLALSRL